MAGGRPGIVSARGNAKNFTINLGQDLDEFINKLRDIRGSSSKADEVRRSIKLMKLVMTEIEKGNDVVIVDEAKPCPECRGHMKQIYLL